MIKIFNISVMLCAAILFMSPTMTKAMPISTVDIVHSGFGANSIVTIWGGGYDNMYVYAGVYELEKSDGYLEGKLWSNGPVGAFCAELMEEAPDTTLTYDVLPLEKGPIPTSFLGGVMGTEKADYVRELWGRYYDSSWFSGGSYSWQQNTKAAAFASAIWEIVHEDLPTSPLGWDVTIDGTPGARGFRVQGIDVNLANNWLHSLTGCGPMADLRIFSYNGAQDYIVQVPEPATIALLGLGGIYSLLKRKKKVLQ
jgi:hypothetical protein